MPPRLLPVLVLLLLSLSALLRAQPLPCIGPSCISLPISAQIGPNSITITVTFNGQPHVFSASLSRIEELDILGTVVATHFFGELQGLVYNVSTVGSVMTFSNGLLSNGAQVTLIYEYFASNGTSMIGSTPVEVPGNTIKNSLVIANWPFLLLTNRLRAHFNISGPTGQKPWTWDDTAKVAKILAPQGLTFYCALLSQGLQNGAPVNWTVDDDLSTHTYYYEVPAALGATYYIDPTFGVLVDDTSGGTSNLNVIIPAAVVGGVVALAIIAGILLWLVVIKPRRNQKGVLIGTKPEDKATTA